MPKVSVLMSHAGDTAFLSAACDSLLAQHYRDFELIVIDDGAGVDWQKLLVGAVWRFRVVEHRTALGLARSLNDGARIACGEYLARMDSDDRSAPLRLARQVEWLERHPEIAVLGSAHWLIDRQDRPLARNYPLTESRDLDLGLLLYNQMTHGSVLMRRASFEAVGGYDEGLRVAQDYDLWLRLRARGSAFANLAAPLYSLRMHRRSASRVRAAEQDETAAQLRAAVSPELLAAALDGWLRHAHRSGAARPYSHLQLAKLALYSSASIGRLPGLELRLRTLGFGIRQASGIVELLCREASWRTGTWSKVSHLFGRIAGREFSS